jgi:hypothetical protein
LVGNHVCVRHQRLRRMLSHPLRHEVKRMQPPVQGVGNNDRGKAYVSMNLATAERVAALRTLPHFRPGKKRTILQSAFRNATACATWLRPSAM